MKNTSQMARGIALSLTRRLFDMANEIGSDVINLTLGDPDVLPPIEIRETACRAIMEGKTRYSANAGLTEVREAYVGFFERNYGMKIERDEVIATVGGMEALYLALASIVDLGDEVIIFAPYYVNYLQMIHIFGGKAVIIDSLNRTGEELCREVEAKISSRTVALLINSPGNPSGEILQPGILDCLAKIACKNDLLVISDEVYSSLVYDGEKAESIVTRAGMKNRTIVIDSCSKRFAMTGWRLGIAVGPKLIIQNMTKMQENVAACAPLASQYGAICAFREEFDYSYIRSTYEKRRDLVYNAILRNPLLHANKPKATFYCFVDISETGMSSEAFAYALLERYHVAVVPGITYGENYSGYIRIAFTLSEELLLDAMERIQYFCEELI